MSELRKIGRILPTRRNAEAMLRFTSEDLARAKVSAGEIWHVSDPENTPLVDAQIGRLRRHRERYLGAIAGRQGLGGGVEGFVKYNEWRVADQIPFEEGEAAASLEAIQVKGEQQFRGRPLGIFALHVADMQPENRQLFVARTLVDEVLIRNAGREVRIGVHETDPLKDFLVNERRFEPTNKTGSPLEQVPDYRTQLYVRHVADE